MKATASRNEREPAMYPPMPYMPHPMYYPAMMPPPPVHYMAYGMHHHHPYMDYYGHPPHGMPPPPTAQQPMFHQAYSYDERMINKPNNDQPMY